MSSSRIATLRWDGRCLQLIDQRVLPMQERYLACARADDVAAAIRDMVVRGAPAIGCAAAYGVALEAIHLARLNLRRHLATELRATFESTWQALAPNEPYAPDGAQVGVESMAGWLVSRRTPEPSRFIT